MRQGSQEDDLDQSEMVIEPELPVDSEHPIDSQSETDGTYPVDRLKARIGRSLGDRPVMVYLVLFAGAATLLLLLAIVWISATGSNPEERPICTAISAEEARDAIMAGQVKRINVLVDNANPLQSLTGLVLEFSDGTCRQPAQGADVRGDLYMILGVVEMYNNYGDQRVRLHYQRQEIQDTLLFTSTPTPSPTLIPTETSTAGITETATPPPPEPTMTPTPTSSPPAATSTHPATIASPAGSTPTASATITSTVTQSPTSAP